MIPSCACQLQQVRRCLVLTGGPGAGKTAVLEMARRSLCEHVAIVPEAAGIVFGGGFPRTSELGVQRAAQRAIFAVQRELEAATLAQGAGVMLCDRGTVDGAAYWPGPDDYWDAVGVRRLDMLARYDVVIHLRVPSVPDGYGHQNPLRRETPQEARAIDERILQAWEGHPRRTIIEPTTDFFEKARQTLEILRRELPFCCRDHIPPLTTSAGQKDQGRMGDVCPPSADALVAVPGRTEAARGGTL